MLRVYDCITDQHDLRFVAVAAIICLFACFTAVSLLGRARVASGRGRMVWLTTGAVVGGAGIWATHFVAMLAFLQSFPVAYDIGLTLASIAIAISVTWCGFFIALEGRKHALIGGVIAGLAISSMHYVGMAAVRAPAVPLWDDAYVVASVLIGVVFVAAALRLADVAVTTMRRRLQTSSLYALGIVGMHFTAMAAVEYLPDALIPVPPVVMDREWLSIAVAVVTVMIIAFGFIGSLVDQHLADRLAIEAKRLQAHVEELEATKQELELTTASLTLALDQAAASSQAKSQFLAAMSHELRTPLNAVIGFSELMKSEIYGPMGDGRYRDYAGSICDSGAHLLDLINDVLDVSRLDAGGIELSETEIEVEQLIREAIRMIDGQARAAEVSLTTDVAADLPQLRGDERRIRQVLLNLLSNALKFTPAGGGVQITALRHPRGISIIVADTGIGIAEQDIPRALERFGQVDNSFARRFEGTGLGLPLSKSLMELHGGTLDLESVVGVGTTVTVTFPTERIVARRQVA